MSSLMSFIVNECIEFARTTGESPTSIRMSKDLWHELLGDMDNEEGKNVEPNFTDGKPWKIFGVPVTIVKQNYISVE